MIVKDEIKILKRCFDSIVDYLDYWVICDTGSTDNTQNFIKEYFREKNIEGELHQVPWVNFGHNRTVCIQNSYKKADYILLLDADFTVNIIDKNFKETLTHEGYLIKYTGNLNYRQMLLVSGNVLYKYVGVTHEYIEAVNKSINQANTDTIAISHLSDGNNKKDKFERDITLLTQGIKDEPNNARYYFYLANSYYDISNYVKASEYYKKRVSMGGWNEEVYYSAYKYAMCKMYLKNKLKLSIEEIGLDFIKAYKLRPTRLEALYEIVKYCRLNSQIELGYAFAIMAKDTYVNYPKDILFVNDAIHKFKFIDELAVAAYYVDNHKLAIELNDRIIEMYEKGEINIDIERIYKNKKFSVDILVQNAYTNRLKLDFIHITKTGGTSIENWGKMNNISWGFKNQEYFNKFKRNKYTNYSSWHVPSQYFEVNPYKNETFTVVRNPYTRLISEFYCPWTGHTTSYILKTTNTKENLNHWIQYLIDTDGVNGLPQYLYLPATHILKFETLQEDFANMMKNYKWFIELSNDKSIEEFTKLPHTNVSKEKIKYDIDDLSSDTIKKINEKYTKDFDIFGYSYSK
jgi:hypothetical protein